LFRRRKQGLSRGLLMAATLIACLNATHSTAELATIKGSDGVIRIVPRSELGSVRVPTLEPRAYEHSEYADFRRLPPAFAELSSLIRETANRYGLEPEFVMALVKVESNFNPYAISDKGARGLMQLIPATARLYGLRDYYDPAANLDAGMRHLRMLFERHNHDIDLVLAAYNAGSGAVEQFGGIPPYEETIRFVRDVKKAYRRFSGREALASTIATFSAGANRIATFSDRAGRLYRSMREDGTIVIRDSNNGHFAE